MPDPIKAPENDGDATNDGSASEKARDTQWPIITGYGAYVDELPQLVSGHQWMTAVEDRKGAATQLAQMCLKINQGTAVKSPQNLTKGTYPGVAGKNMPTIPGSVMEGLMSAAEPVYPRWSSASTTPEAT